MENHENYMRSHNLGSPSGEGKQPQSSKNRKVLNPGVSIKRKEKKQSLYAVSKSTETDNKN